MPDFGLVLDRFLHRSLQCNVNVICRNIMLFIRYKCVHLEFSKGFTCTYTYEIRLFSNTDLCIYSFQRGLYNYRGI